LKCCKQKKNVFGISGLIGIYTDWDFVKLPSKWGCGFES